LRSSQRSPLLTTNIDFKPLGDYLGDPVITAAMVDRLVHHAIIISIEGPSYRMYESKKLNRQNRKKRLRLPNSLERERPPALLPHTTLHRTLALLTPVCATCHRILGRYKPEFPQLLGGSTETV
jgi:mono/diheme cytochrome c family protein